MSNSTAPAGAPTTGDIQSQNAQLEQYQAQINLLSAQFNATMAALQQEGHDAGEVRFAQ